MRKGKTTGASQQTLLTIIKSLITTPYGGLQESYQSGTLIRVYVPPALAFGTQRASASLRQKSTKYNVQLNLEHIQQLLYVELMVPNGHTIFRQNPGHLA
jgi:hypothetical protein